MNLLRRILSQSIAEWRLQRLGRQALHEIRFRKYRATPRIGDRFIAERLLRRLPGPAVPFTLTPTH